MENNNNNRIGYNPFMKRIVILMMLIVAMLQTALGQVQITTIPSSGANILQVGTAKQTFTVIIKNLSTSVVTLNSVTVTPFPGVVIQGNRSVDNKGTTINLSNNVFTFPINPVSTLAADDSLTFTYDAIAECAATGQTNKVQDDIALSYTQNGQNNTIKVKSDSYAILYPQLTVATKNLEVTSGNSYDLITEVSNATGAGNADEMQLTVTFPAGTAVVATAPVLVSGSTSVSGMSLPSVINGNSVTYTLNKGVIESMGFTPGSTFYIKQPIKVNSYFDSQQIQYSVSQTINGTVCNAVTSTGTYSLTQGVADPNIAITLYNIIKQVKICDTTGIVRIKIKNRSTHNVSGTAIISALSFSLQNVKIDDFRTTSNNSIPFTTTSLQENSISTLNPSHGVDYDGNGGFGDYNNDGVFLDLKAGDSTFLDITFHLTTAVLYSKYSNINIMNNTTYNGIDNSSYIVDNYVGYDQVQNRTYTLTGSSDIDMGTSNVFGITGRLEPNTTFFASNRQYYLRAIVQPGFTINNQGTELLIPITPMDYSASVTVQSTTASTCGYYPIIWQLIFKEDGCSSNNYSIVSTEQKVFFNHTQNGCTSIPNAVLSLDISRINTGYKGITTSPIFESDLKNYEQYTEANCPNSMLFVANDTMRVKLKVIVPASGTCAYQSITASLTENSSTDYVVPFSATLTVQGNTFTTTNFSVSYLNGKAIRNAIFSFPSGLNILNTDTVSIMILSKLPNSTIENTGIELRGGITTIDCNNKSQGSDTRGNTYKTTAQYLTYVEHSTTVCNGQVEDFTLSAAPTVFVDEFRPEYGIKEMTITKYLGLQYSSFTVTCNSILVPNNKYTVTSDNNFIHIIFTENLILPGYETNQKIEVFCQNGSLCSVLGQSNSVTTNGKVYYSQRGVSKICNASINNPNVLTAYVPFYSFTPSNIVSNDGKTITWSLRVTNTGNLPAPYTIMEWAIAGGKSSLELQKVSINNNDVSISSVGGKSYFMLSTNQTVLQPNKSYDLLLTAKYNGCAFNDSILSTLRTAFNCNYFNYSDFNTYVCDTFTQKLKASTYDFSLVPSIPQSPSSFYNFCDSIPYSVDVFLGNTDSSNVSYWMNPLPSNIIIKGNKINYEFDGKTGTINTTNVFTPNNQIISKEILGNYFSSVPDWNQKSVKLSFNLSIECSNQLITDITKVLSENVLRTNICGAEKKESFDFTPKIHGFENLQKISIAAVANGFDATQQGEVTVTTSNIHTSLVDSVNVTAILPKGVTYKSSTNVSEFEKITSSTDVNGITKVIWAFERGKYVQGLSSVEFKTQLENNLSCSTDSAKVIFISSLQRKVLACNKIDSCIATASSDTAIVYLKRNSPHYISSIIYPDTICNGISDTIKVKTIDAKTVLVFTSNAGTINSKGIFTFDASFVGKAAITVDASGQGCHQDTTIYINVIAPTAITITAVPQLLTSDSPVTLSAIPAGGTWSGAGVVGNTFSPAIGIGTHYVTYTTNKANGHCQVKDSIAIIVNGDCTIRLTVKDQIVCFPDSVIVPININNIFSCGGCADAMNLSILYDATKLTYNNYIFTNDMNSDMYVTLVVPGKINVQLYRKTPSSKKPLFNAGILLKLHFAPQSLGSSDISFGYASTTDGLGNSLPFANIVGKIKVVAPPTVAITKPLDSLCIGSNVTLTATGALTYLWNNDSVATTQTVNPTQTTDYYVTGTDVNGCSGTATTEIAVNSLPTITAASNPSSICVGASSTISANGGLSYIWDNGIGTFANSLVTPIASTAYTVTGTDANGCKNTATTTVTVNQLPTVVATVSIPTICIGSQTTVSASGANAYIWNLQAGIVSPATTTAYTVTGTDANGCTNTANTTVTVNQLPTVVATASIPTICTGSQTTVSASGANAYTWNPQAGIVSPATTTAYTVTGTDANGCTNTASTTVTVNQLPTVVATASIPTICAGNQTTVSANGANAYIWNPQAGIVSPATTTTYRVTGTTTQGCSNTATITVTVDPIPTISAISGSTTSSAGVTVTYTVTAQTGVVFNWTVTGGTIVSGQGTNQISVQFTTLPASIHVTATSNGCISSVESLAVTQTTVAITGNTVICKDNSTDNWNTANYTVTTPATGATYNWSVGAGATLYNTTGNTVGVLFSSGIGTVTVTVTETIGGQITGIGSIVINKNLRPSTPGTISGKQGWGGVCLTEQGVVYTVTAGTSPTYLWTVASGNTIVSGQGTNSIVVNFNGVAGMISVSGQNGEGCLSYTSPSVYVGPNGVCPVTALKSFVEASNNDETTVEATNIIPSITDVINTVTVIPQPAKNEVRVVSTSPVKMVTMYDMNGKVVISTKSITVIDISILPSGTYQMVIETEAGIFNRTVVVMK